MNDDNEIEYFNTLMSIVIGWRLSGAKSVILLCIFQHMFIKKTKTVKITIEEFMVETHYSRQSIIEALQYLSDRSIITRELDKNNKNYLYSIVIYDMEENERIERTMKSYKKIGNGFSAWGVNSAEAESEDKKAHKKYRYETVDEWNYNDFSFFMEDFITHFCKKNHIDISDLQFIFNSSFRRNQSYLNIVDYLHGKSGNHFCKLMLKAYIEWYVVNVFQSVLPKLKVIDGKKQFLICHLNNKTSMQTFLDKHMITENMKDVRSVELQLSSYKKLLKKDSKDHEVKSIHRVTLKDMEDYYHLGISTLLSECGIVLTGNYLIEHENKTFQDAADEIAQYIKCLNLSHERQKKALIDIVDKTCLGSPYYKTFKFLNWYLLYEGVFSQLKEKFDMSGFTITESKQRNSYDFLLEKEKIEA